MEISIDYKESVFAYLCFLGNKYKMTTNMSKMDELKMLSMLEIFMTTKELDNVLYKRLYEVTLWPS